MYRHSCNVSMHSLFAADVRQCCPRLSSVYNDKRKKSIRCKHSGPLCPTIERQSYCVFRLLTMFSFCFEHECLRELDDIPTCGHFEVVRLSMILLRSIATESFASRWNCVADRVTLCVQGMRIYWTFYKMIVIVFFYNKLLYLSYIAC